MELLLLLLLIPIAWLALVRRRMANEARRYRMSTAGIAVGAALAVWVAFLAFSGPSQQKVDYGTGDDQVRAILHQPDVAPRYSSRN